MRMRHSRLAVVGELRLESQVEARIVGSNVDPVALADQSAQRLDVERVFPPAVLEVRECVGIAPV